MFMKLTPDVTLKKIRAHLFFAVLNQAFFPNITLVAKPAIELVEEEVMHFNVTHGVVNGLKENRSRMLKLLNVVAEDALECKNTLKNYSLKITFSNNEH